MSTTMMQEGKSTYSKMQLNDFKQLNNFSILNFEVSIISNESRRDSSHK